MSVEMFVITDEIFQADQFSEAKHILLIHLTDSS